MVWPFSDTTLAAKGSTAITKKEYTAAGQIQTNYNTSSQTTTTRSSVDSRSYQMTDARVFAPQYSAVINSSGSSAGNALTPTVAPSLVPTVSVPTQVGQTAKSDQGGSMLGGVSPLTLALVAGGALLAFWGFKKK